MEMNCKPPFVSIYKIKEVTEIKSKLETEHELDQVQLVIYCASSTEEKEKEIAIELNIDTIPKAVGLNQTVFQLIGIINYKGDQYSAIVPNFQNEGFTKLSDSKPKKSKYVAKKCSFNSLLYIKN